MDIPGISEAELVDILYQSTRAAAIKYCFGYHSIEDMQSHAILECLEILEKGKFVPKGNKPIAQQLGNFLRTHSRNRLSNLVRNKSYRYASGETPANKTKFGLMHPLQIYSQGLDRSEIFAHENDEISRVDKKQVIQHIRKQLTLEEDKDFLKYLAGAKLSIKRREALFKKVAELTSEEKKDTLHS